MNRSIKFSFIYRNIYPSQMFYILNVIFLSFLTFIYIANIPRIDIPRILMIIYFADNARRMAFLGILQNDFPET